MSWLTGVAMYCVVWWVVLMAVLPWGVRVPDKVEEGHATSAPSHPRLWLKAGATTVISAVVWALLYGLITSGAVSLRPS